ncbi:MAG TPA: glycosyltransferase [Candidatus Methylomirabilis sp.]|nr:glycosyltransferase [Candidatus Methylomirabilis sp.]
MVQISVVIPVADAGRLPRCLEALARQTLDPSVYEVLVADNEAREGTRRIAEATPARYLIAPGPGSYAARNAGVREAKGVIVALTDADCVAPPGWLAAIGSVFERGDADVVVGPSYGLNTDPIGQFVQRIDDQRWARMAGDTRMTYCDTRNLAARRDVLLREPFDETFRHGGDLEWGIRMARRGARIVHTPEMAVGHTNVSTLRDAWRRGVRRGRGVAGLVDKHGDDVRISGARSLRLLGVDAKTPLIRMLTRPAVRPLSRAALTAANAVIMGSVATCLALPVLRPAAPPLFHLFDRVSLLLGRTIGK